MYLQVVEKHSERKILRRMSKAGQRCPKTSALQLYFDFLKMIALQFNSRTGL